MCDKNEALQILREAHARCSAVIPISDAYLYGSYARGDYRDSSDVDIMLVSPLSQAEIDARSWDISEIVGEMCIDHDVTISVSVRPRDRFDPAALPYYNSIVTEGIRYA